MAQKIKFIKNTKLKKVGDIKEEDKNNFSYFQNGIKNTVPNDIIDLNQFLELIKKDNSLLKQIRGCADKKERDKLKSKLDYVTFNGIFSKRNNESLIQPSGLICLDYDDIENPNELKKELSKDEYTHCVFISPSGKGLKLIVKIPIFKNDDEFLGYWVSIKEHYKINVDTGTKDVSRACYLSFDEKPYFNSNSKIYKKCSARLWEKMEELIEGKKDTSRSGLEYRKILALLRNGKTRKEIYEEMKAYSKWSNSNEQYKNLTFEKAEKFYLQEQDRGKEAEIRTKKPNKDIFVKTKRIIQKYIDTTELNYNLLTTWTLGTHFHEKFETYPLLLLMARKQAGKSRCLKLLSSLSQGSDGSTSTSVTETFLFRHKKGALFFDEMESISSREKGTLRETINAIYKKGNKIIRYAEQKTLKGKEYVEQEFFPFYPLGLANIYGFGDVLMDRSIQIILQRSNKRQTQLIEDFSTNQEILNLKDELIKINIDIPTAIFSEWNNYIQKKSYNQELKHFFQQIEDTHLKGRPLEIFFPLFLVGQQFGILDILIESSKEYLLQLEGEALDNPDDLLQDFIDKNDYTGYHSLLDILKDFKNSLEESQEWMNSKWFGRALKRLGVINKKRLINGRVQVELKTNTTNPIYPINTTNTTNTTNNNPKDDNLVELVELVELGGVVDKKDNSIDFTKSGIKEAFENE